MRLLFPASYETMDFFNTLTLGQLSTPRRPSTLDRSAIHDPLPQFPTLDPLMSRFSSVKGFNKTMSSLLGKSNRLMMVRSSAKLFWNGVSDRIIHFLVQSSARAFRISLFGRPLLKFVPKGGLSYRRLRSRITLQNFVPSCPGYFRLMMKPWISSIL